MDDCFHVLMVLGRVLLTHTAWGIFVAITQSEEKRNTCKAVLIVYVLVLLFGALKDIKETSWDRWNAIWHKDWTTAIALEIQRNLSFYWEWDMSLLGSFHSVMTFIYRLTVKSLKNEAVTVLKQTCCICGLLIDSLKESIAINSVFIKLKALFILINLYRIYSNTVTFVQLGDGNGEMDTVVSVQ